MTTALQTQIEVPDALRAALDEMNRRLAVAETLAGTREEASIVVINDAPDGLKDQGVLWAVLTLARNAHHTNMSVEMRGHVLCPTVDDFGGSAELRRHAMGPNPSVFYRCLRPMRTVPYKMIEPGVTRVVHTDPRVLASGRADSGTFVGWHGERVWAAVRFDRTPADAEPAVLLVSDLLVEVKPE